ncbi:hypothetical protein MOB65_20395 [Bacillus inaquosorum]|uniref:hypothetical protein n=1 Tax=Bacillus inaquosorum TaxID=483913 RepID=UPI0022800AD8|nr:hypothetical protein [Bacillus inaquosorum]MCY7911219.1 hypothetical protein [Bacillus inaquosorum]
MDLSVQLADHLILKIKKSKYKVLSIKQVQEFLKETLGEEYSSDISIRVKNILMSHPSLDFFKEGYYYNNDKSYFSSGSWLAYKDTYENPVQAKFKMGWHAWMESAEDENIID